MFEDVGTDDISVEVIPEMKLTDILLDQVLFLALSNDTVIDADAAVTQLESLLADMSALEPSEKDPLKESIEHRISTAGSEECDVLSDILDQLN